MEPKCPVHEPWVKLSQDNDITWQPRDKDQYTGSGCGGLAGPSLAMLQIARSATSFVALFLFIVPLVFFEKVAGFTRKHCYEDYVVKIFARGMGRRRRSDTLSMCLRSLEQGCILVSGDVQIRKKTIHYHRWLLCNGMIRCSLWHAQTCRWKNVVGQTPWHIHIPYMKNALTRYAYVFMR